MKRAGKTKTKNEYRISNAECRRKEGVYHSKFKVCSLFKASGKSQRSSSGFTLLEVLVALALLGIAVTAVLQVFSANLKSLSASEEYVAGSLEAQSKMREVLEGGEFNEGSWSGVTDNGYRFQVSVSDTLMERTESLPVKLVTVQVTVYWDRVFREKSLTLKTLKMVEKPA